MTFQSFFSLWRQQSSKRVFFWPIPFRYSVPAPIPHHTLTGHFIHLATNTCLRYGCPTVHLPSEAWFWHPGAPRPTSHLSQPNLITNSWSFDFSTCAFAAANCTNCCSLLLRVATLCMPNPSSRRTFLYLVFRCLRPLIRRIHRLTPCSFSTVFLPLALPYL